MATEFEGACPMCGEVYRDPVELETHASECLGEDKPIEISDDEEQMEACPLCGLVFIDQTELTQHVEACAPTRFEPLACPLCSRVFIDGDELHLHAANCDGTSEAPPPPPQRHALNLRQRQALQRKRVRNDNCYTEELLNQALRLYKYSKSLE